MTKRMTPAARFQRWTQGFLARTLGLHMYRRPPFGHDALAEIRRLHQWTPGDVVFDVGANDGRTVAKLQRYFSSPRIFAFEPVGETFQQLVSRTEGMQNVRRFQMALGAEAAERTIYTGSSSVLNSFSPEGWEPSGTEAVKVSTVDWMVAELGIDYIQLLKVDTEGYDLDVLRGAEEALSTDRIGIIQVEAGFDQDSRPRASLDDIRRYLASHSYSLFGIFNQSRTPSGPRTREGIRNPDRQRVPNVLAYCDGVFVSNALLYQNFGHSG